MAENSIKLEVIEENPKEESGATESENIKKTIEAEVEKALKEKVQERQQQQQLEQTGPNGEKVIRLVDVPINDQMTALNVLIGFIQGAQQKGIFSFEESHKIWECIQQFKQGNSQ